MNPSVDLYPGASVFSTFHDSRLRGLWKTGILFDGDLLGLFQVLRSLIGIILFSLCLIIVFVLLSNPQFLDFLQLWFSSWLKFLSNILLFCKQSIELSWVIYFSIILSVHVDDWEGFLSSMSHSLKDGFEGISFSAISSIIVATFFRREYFG